MPAARLSSAASISFSTCPGAASTIAPTCWASAAVFRCAATWRANSALICAAGSLFGALIWPIVAASSSPVSPCPLLSKLDRVVIAPSFARVRNRALPPSATTYQVASPCCAIVALQEMSVSNAARA
jgi:hypothetical protein